MTLAERLRAILDPLPPGAAVTLPAEVLRAWLAEDAPESRRIATELEVDLTVAQVADLFARGQSTVRVWLSEGRFPTAYKLGGKEWRVPRAAVDAFQKAESARSRVSQGAEQKVVDADVARKAAELTQPPRRRRLKTV